MSTSPKYSVSSSSLFVSSSRNVTFGIFDIMYGGSFACITVSVTMLLFTYCPSSSVAVNWISFSPVKLLFGVRLNPPVWLLIDTVMSVGCTDM